MADLTQLPRIPSPLEAASAHLGRSLVDALTAREPSLAETTKRLFPRSPLADAAARIFTLQPEGQPHGR